MTTASSYPSQTESSVVSALPTQRAGRLVMTSVRLDRQLHQALRQIAFDRRQSLHSLLIEGAKTVCQRYQQDGATAAE
jgi:predicted DNA-binding ribbon-helix-helix protein